jgi:hypothetical protein
MMARQRLAGKAIRIVSGGQRGVDRAALAWAIRRGVPYEGGVRKDGGQRTERFAGEEFDQKRTSP